MSDGITESLTNLLAAETSNLVVKPYTTVSGFKDNETDYLETSRNLGVDTVVIGKLIKRDDTILLQNSLVNVLDGSKFWSEETVFNTADTLYAEEQISRKVILSLKAEENNRSEKGGGKQQTSNPEAFRYYMLGRYYW